jgi:outer membrane protein TolC
MLSRVEGRSAHQAIAAARANLQLQKATGRPDLEALLGYKRNIGFDTGLAGLQMNLPLFDRNQGAVAAAAADTQAALDDYEAVRQQLASQLSIAQREYDLEREQYLQTFKPLRDQALEISDISRAAYKEGGLDLVRLLDSERVRVEAEVTWVQALEAYHQSVVSLEYAEGVQP